MKKHRQVLIAVILGLLFGQTATVLAAGNSSETNSTALSNGPGKLESLSGINIIPVKQNGTFELQLTNAVKDDGIIELTNAAGQLIFSQPVSAIENSGAKKVNVGKLKSGVYLIEVKSGNTIYWKKVRVRN